MYFASCISRPKSIDRLSSYLWQLQLKQNFSKTCANSQWEFRTHWRHWRTEYIPHKSPYWSGRCICTGLLTNQSASSSANQRSGPPWRILFFGSDEFSVEVLRKLKANNTRTKSADRVVEALEVVCSPKRVPVRTYANEHHLPLHDWPLQGSCDQFDVGVVASFGFLIPKKVIRLFPYGILNIHPSLLPRWRGASPVFHTILHGDEVTGVTIIHITPQFVVFRFDVGPILQQESVPVPDRCQAVQLGSMLFDRGADMLLQCLRDLPRKLENAVKQPSTGATNAPKLSVDQSWVRWAEQSSQEIDRLYRSVGQKLPLRSIWNGRTVKLMDILDPDITKGLTLPVTDPKPGSAHYHKPTNSVCIRCQDGWVGFRSILLKKKLNAQEFYNGYLSREHLKEKLFETSSSETS
ncbi:PREDICTED: methionyl-tRNA formyltransferase, mitochondrial-like [Branchiostoma belcheri]|uniref:Methionyl-tRNA formyltransferase, mitochondrial n=1 Tax=Branchiostoma belcheri TaxID=7741 RepID=A0A6P4YEQ8_BRABE|nr:PREDICTED: methionyl-tRNA formyltransferase, mitochondrial-like [Branchiostoma belcheri]